MTEKEYDGLSIGDFVESVKGKTVHYKLNDVYEDEDGRLIFTLKSLSDE